MQDDWAFVLAYALIGVPVTLALAYHGIYRVAGLHWLWGGVFLLVGVLWAGWFLADWLKSGTWPPRLTERWPLMLVSLAFGWLMFFDPKIRRYRRALRDHERSAR